MQSKTASGLSRVLLSVFVAMACSCDSSSQGNSVQKNEFVQIFDGKTLKGWEGDPAIWRVEGGSLIGELTPEKQLKNNTFLIWRGGKPANFELILEFKITKSGNSGINYRSVEVGEVPHALKGYQADIDGANRYTGQNYEERGRTTLAYRGEQVDINASGIPTDSLRVYIKNNAWTSRKVTGTLGNTDSLQSKIKSEDWNTYRLVVRGNRLRHYINNILMSDVTDNDNINGKAEGLLGLQVHVGPPMKVEYRNIQLKEL